MREGQSIGFSGIPGLNHPSDEDLSPGTPEIETWGTRRSLSLSHYSHNFHLNFHIVAPADAFGTK